MQNSSVGSAGRYDLSTKKAEYKRGYKLMRKVLVILLLFIVAYSFSACRSQNELQLESSSQLALELESDQKELAENTQDRILIAYFSLKENVEYSDNVDASTSASLVVDNDELYGTTEYVAKLIQENAGGDIYKIQTVELYPSVFDDVVDQNHEEADQGFLPELIESDLDISKYDTIFIGYPIWATNAPQAIFSFLSEYDLSGKTIIPFCTHDGYGAGNSYTNIANAVPNAEKVVDGIAIEASDVLEATSTIEQWLSNIGFENKSNEGSQADGTDITITIGDVVLDGVIYDTALADEIKEYFPLTVSMVGYGGREFYGGVEFYPENLEGGQRNFENGDITYCELHHNMAIFYAQTDHPELSVDVIPIGKVTSDLAVFDEFEESIDVTFALAE